MSAPKQLAATQWPRPCRHCGEMYDSAGKLGAHTRNRHPSGKTPPAKARREKRARQVAQEVNIPAALSDAASEFSTTKKGAPSVDETTRLLGRLLLYLSIFIALAIMRGDPSIASEEHKDAQLAQLQLDTDASRSIAHPFARVVSDTKVWKLHGRKIVEHADVIDAVAALYEWGSTLARYERHKRQRVAGEVSPVHTAPPPPPPAPPSPNGSGPAHAPMTWEERQGVVVSREMLTGRSTRTPGAAEET